MSAADVDVLVVGGGPVGLAAAIEARLAGLTVVIVEPRADTIDKACGEGLLPGALPLLARLGVDPDGVPLRGVSYRSGTRQADHLFRGSPGRGVRRTTLHDALSARAGELGAVSRLHERIVALEQDPNGVTAQTSTDSIRASWLLGCDGLHSTVRRLAGLAAPAPTRVRRFGLRQHFATAPWSELIEVHWTPAAEAYVTPVDAGLVGVAVLGRARTDFDGTIASIPQLAERLRGTDPVGRVRGAGPFRQRARSPSSGRVLLAGDSSGYVDAITGEGLRLGIAQARAAIGVVVDGDAGRYDREWRRITRDFRMLTAGLVRASGGPLRPAIVPLAAALPRLYGATVERLAR